MCLPTQVTTSTHCETTGRPTSSTMNNADLMPLTNSLMDNLMDDFDDTEHQKRSVKCHHYKCYLDMWHMIKQYNYCDIPRTVIFHELWCMIKI